MTDPSALEICTPVWVDLDAERPWVLWVDLQDVDLSCASLHDVMGRAVQANPRRRRIRTGLEELDVGGSGLEPELAIFHVSPRGADLVSDAVARYPDIQLIRDAAPVNSILAARRVDESARVDLLRRLAAALARPRASRWRLVLKLYSWNVQHLPVFRKAFPRMRWIFVYGDPLGMMHAVWPRRLTWLGFVAEPSEAAHFVGMTADEIRAIPSEEFFARVLAGSCEAGLRYLDESGRLINDQDLPKAVEDEVLPLLGLSGTPPEREAHPLPEDEDDDEDEDPPPAQLGEVADRWLGDVYGRLEARRAMR